jgi:hypothetical protein
MTAEAGGRNVDRMQHPCCMEDGGSPSGGGLQDQHLNHPALLGVKLPGGEPNAPSVSPRVRDRLQWSERKTSSENAQKSSAFNGDSRALRSERESNIFRSSDGPQSPRRLTVAHASAFRYSARGGRRVTPIRSPSPLLAGDSIWSVDSCNFLFKHLPPPALRPWEAVEGDRWATVFPNQAV